MADSDDLPFACSEPGCTMKFTNEDHMMVHLQKHQMSLTLSTGGNKFLYQDQTPTPTKFLKNCEEIGLFSEINSKNPFDDAFSKAVTESRSKSPESPSMEKASLLGVSNDAPDTLNTPTPQLQTDTPLKKRYLRYQSLEQNEPDFTLALPTVGTGDTPSPLLLAKTGNKNSASVDIPSIKIDTSALNGASNNREDPLKNKQDGKADNLGVTLKRQSNVNDELSETPRFGTNASSEPIVKRMKPDLPPAQLVSPISSAHTPSQESIAAYEYLSEDARHSSFDQEASNHGYSAQTQLVSPAASNQSYSHDSLLSPAGSTLVAAQRMSRDPSLVSPAGSSNHNTPVGTPRDSLRDTIISPNGHLSRDEFMTSSNGGNNSQQGRPRPPNLHVKSDYLAAIRPEQATLSETLPRIELGDLQTDFAGNTPLNLSAGNTPTEAVPGIKPTVLPPVLQGAPVQSSGGLVLKVMVQTPEGNYMPVHIPAAIPANAVAAAVPSLATSDTSTLATAQTTNANSYIDLSPASTPRSQASTPIKPEIKTETPASNASGTSNASSFAKQKLKAQLLQNSGNMALMTEAVDRVTSQGTSKSRLASQSWSTSRDSSINSSFEVEYQDADSTDRNSQSGTAPSTQSECDETDIKRQKFLERNRAAAMRCRNKKKQWVSNLEKKAEELQSTNTRLQNEVTTLRAELAQLKTLLLAHKDCPITQMQREKGELMPFINPTTEENRQPKARSSGQHTMANPAKILPAITTNQMQAPPPKQQSLANQIQVMDTIDSNSQNEQWNSVPSQAGLVTSQGHIITSQGRTLTELTSVSQGGGGTHHIMAQTGSNGQHIFLPVASTGGTGIAIDLTKLNQS